MADDKDIVVMINGLPGKMATLLARRIAADDEFGLALVSFTGPEIKESEFSIMKGVTIQLIPVMKTVDADGKTTSDTRNQYLKFMNYTSNDSIFIVVDFSLPYAINGNVEFYCANGFNFVTGTTGGDREKLAETVRNSNVAAVIAPNMAKQIVGLQAMLEYAAETFPNLFAGHSLEIIESHQQGKKGASGTAVDMVEYFKKMGIPFDIKDICSIRKPVEQSAMGIPEEHLGGHGWHSYHVTSSNKSVHIGFVHDVNGRDVYVDGTIEAIRFLAKKIQENAKGQVFSMIDVIKAG